MADLLTPEAIDVLLEHDWPGNVRELANVMEHAYIIAGGGRSLPEHLPHHIRRRGRHGRRSAWRWPGDRRAGRRRGRGR